MHSRLIYPAALDEQRNAMQSRATQQLAGLLNHARNHLLSLGNVTSLAYRAEGKDPESRDAPAHCVSYDITVEIAAQHSSSYLLQYRQDGYLIRPLHAGSIINEMIAMQPVRAGAPVPQFETPPDQLPVHKTNFYSLFSASEFLAQTGRFSGGRATFLLVLGAGNQPRLLQRLRIILWRLKRDLPSDTAFLVMVPTQNEVNALLTDTDTDAGADLMLEPDRIRVFQWRNDQEILALINLADQCGFLASSLYADAHRLGVPVQFCEPCTETEPLTNTSLDLTLQCNNTSRAFTSKLDKMLNTSLQFPYQRIKPTKNDNRQAVMPQSNPDNAIKTIKLRRQWRAWQTKLTKLRHSPKHFFLDSKLLQTWRSETKA